MSEKDLVHHYKLLKQFLDISDDSSRSNKSSSRAARAREKLLKLSLGQFKELSTDVYDELKRRIDESRGEPDYLLPKATFHPKRNQARQKLASLPQSRFKDLVSDISYEIERRGLHIDRSDTVKSEPSYVSKSTVNSNSVSTTESHNVTKDVDSLGHKDISVADLDANVNTNHSVDLEPVTLEPKSFDSKALDTKETNSLTSTNNDKTDSKISNKSLESKKTLDSKASLEDHSSIGLQSRTVVPTKANLTWSSDEEDDDVDHHQEKQINAKDVPIQGNASDSKAVDDLKAQLANLQASKDEIERKYKLLQEDYDFSMNQNKTLSNELDAVAQEKQNWLNQNAAHEHLEKELENLKSVNASLRLENQSLKSSPKHSQKEIVTPLLSHSKSSNQNIAALDKELASANVSPSDKEVMQSNIPLSTKVLSSTTPTSHKQEALTDRQALASTAAPASALGAPSSINDKVDLILQKMSTLDKPNSVINDNDAKLWQTKYEQLRSNQITRSFEDSLPKDLQPFVTSNGLISLKLVADIQALIESFIIQLNSNKRNPDALFDKISKISVTANEIANQGDSQHLNSNEYSTSVRAAVNYALTTIRYYGIYDTLLPKIIVERAIGELSFTICDLISDSKLNTNSSNSRSVIVDKATSNVSDNFGVRPLRMANKLKEAHFEPDLKTPLHNSKLAGSPSSTEKVGDKDLKPLKKNAIDVTSKNDSDTTFDESPLKSKELKSAAANNVNVKNQPTSFFSKLKNKLATVPTVANGQPEKESDISPKDNLGSTENKPKELNNQETVKLSKELRSKETDKSLNSKELDPGMKSVSQKLNTTVEPVNADLDSVKNIAPKDLKADAIEAVKSDLDSAKNFAPKDLKADEIEAVKSDLDSAKNFAPKDLKADAIEKSLEADELKSEEISTLKELNSDAVKEPQDARTNTALESSELMGTETTTTVPLETQAKTDTETKELNATPRSSNVVNEKDATEKLDDKTSPKNKNITALASRFENTQEDKSKATTKTSPITKTGVKSLASKWNTSVESTPTKSPKHVTSPGSILSKVKNFEQEKTPVKELGSPVKAALKKAEQVSSSLPLESKIDTEGPEKESDHKIAKSVGVAAAAGAAVGVSAAVAKKALPSSNLDDDFPLSKKLISNSNLVPPSVATTDNDAVSDAHVDTENRNILKRASNGSLNHKPLSDIGNVQNNNHSPESGNQKVSLVSVPASSDHVVPISTATSGASTAPVSKSVKINSDVDEVYAPGSEDDSDYDEEYDEVEEQENQKARRRQEQRKSMAAATFNVDLFDIDDPDNSLTQVLLYLEHQTVEVISTIQTLLTAIKKPNATRGELREKSKAITIVILQMTEATNTSMNQTRNAQLKEHGNWVVKSLEDCDHRMTILCKPNSDKSDDEYADKSFKQRLAGISFDIAKCTKELVKTVEEASLKEDIEYLNNRISREEDLT